MSHQEQSQSIWAITLNLTLASLLAGVVIAGVYFFTAPYAERQERVQQQKALQTLVPAAEAFVVVSGHPDWFAAEVKHKVVAYVIKTIGRGYGGKINLLVAIDPHGTIIDYRILAHSETPGLGDRADLPGFKAQFHGKKIANLEVVKDHTPGKIDAITGATITSRAVTKAIRLALADELAYIQQNTRSK